LYPRLAHRHWAAPEPPLLSRRLSSSTQFRTTVIDAEEFSSAVLSTTRKRLPSGEMS